MARYGFIWPKDPQPGNPKHWPRRWRWRDILLNKGPDIYIGRIDVPISTQNSPHWSGWPDGNGGKSQNQQQQRAPEEKYDFRRRKYCRPDDDSWSGVAYCHRSCCENSAKGDASGGGKKKHIIPHVYFDKNGVAFPAHLWHDYVYSQPSPHEHEDKSHPHRPDQQQQPKHGQNRDPRSLVQDQQQHQPCRHRHHPSPCHGYAARRNGQGYNSRRRDQSPVRKQPA